MSELLNTLNQEQNAAVSLPLESALILAGAGSGKTRVLTTRIAWLLESKQLSPSNIMAVTFTNKAAKEMVSRLSSLVSFDLKNMWIGTFHGLCHRFLRLHYQEAGLPRHFQIIDTSDQLAIIKRLLKEKNIDDKLFPARELQWFINGQKEKGLRAQDINAYDENIQKKVQLYADYTSLSDKEGYVDFPELLLRCFETLKNHHLLKEHYQKRFEHILIDEFQDTSLFQYDWLKIMTNETTSLFCVGDDDQSIYSFRGADVNNMQRLINDFQVRHTIKLEQNYRSHGNILAAANAIIENNDNRVGKNLWTTSEAGEPIRLYEALTDQEEAQWIVEESKALEREGIDFGSMTILYRSNAQSRVLEHALFTANVPFKVYGGLRFFERQEIKHALAYLRLIANQDDDAALLRIINFPTRGIGSRTIEELQNIAHHQQCSLYRAIAYSSGKRHTILSQFVDLIETMITCKDLPLPQLVDQTIIQSGLRAHYENEKDGKNQLENLDELVSAAVTFAASPYATQSLTEDNENEAELLSFLSNAALEGGEHQTETNQSSIQLMTVHAAKGLEFNIVFIAGLEEGLFPHDQAKYSQNEKGIEEERRLMYVATTRARKHLYLALSHQRMLHGQIRNHIPSRFIEEIPDSLLKRLNHVPQQSHRVSGSVRGNQYASAYPQQQYGNTKHSVTNKTNGYTAPKPKNEITGHDLRIGQKVHHAKFGNGVILNAEGHHNDARAQIRFESGSVKWLALSVAKLDRI